MSKELRTEYETLLKEFEDGHRRMKKIKQRLAQIRQALNIPGGLVADQPGESYSR